MRRERKNQGDMYLNIKTANSLYAYIGLKMYINMKISSETKEQFLDTLHVFCHSVLFGTLFWPYLVLKYLNT